MLFKMGFHFFLLLMPMHEQQMNYVDFHKELVGNCYRQSMKYFLNHNMWLECVPLPSLRVKNISSHQNKTLLKYLIACHFLERRRFQNIMATDALSLRMENKSGRSNIQQKVVSGQNSSPQTIYMLKAHPRIGLRHFFQFMMALRQSPPIKQLLDTQMGNVHEHKGLVNGSTG